MKTYITILLIFLAAFNVKSQCPDAGPNNTVCGQTAQLASLGISGYWSGPAGAIYTPSDTDPNASVWIPSYTGASHQETFTWNETGCTPADQVTITFIKPPHSDGGVNESICGTITELVADTIGSGIISAYWTSSVPGIIITQIGTESVPFHVSVDASTVPNLWINSQREAWFYWIIQNGSGCSATDSVRVTFYQIPEANAGLDTSTCGKIFDLQGSWSIDNPVGTWTDLPPNPGTASFNPNNDPNGTVTVTQYGLYHFIWKEMNNGNTTCFDRDTVTINFKSVPMPDAGLDFSVCGSWAHIHATPSCPGGQWSAPSGTAFYDGINGNYNNSYRDSASSYIRWPSENDTVTMYWSEFNGVCYGYDSVNVYFGSIQPAISLVDPADSVVCGPTFNLLNAQQPAYGYGYWMDTIMNTYFFPSPNIPSPIAIIDTGSLDYTGYHHFYWITVNGDCRDTSNVVNVKFNVVPSPHTGSDFTVCGQWAQICALPSVSGGQWGGPSGIAYYDAPNGNYLPNGNDSICVWINWATENDTITMYWQENNLFCTASDSVNIYFQSCGFAGPDNHTCGQSYSFQATANYLSGSSFHWTCLTTAVLFSNDTILNPEVILPDFSINSITLSFVLTEINISNSFESSDTVNITFFDGCNEIRGVVFYDVNYNGIYDLGDYTANNVIVKIDNDYVSTNNSGMYNYITLSGYHVITIPSQPSYIEINPLYNTATFSGINSIDSLNNFALTFEQDTNLSIYCYMSAARPGFDCYHYAFIRNEGLKPLDASLRFVLDPQVQYNTASPLPDVITGNILEWHHIPMTVNEWKEISINTTIPASLPLNTVLFDSAYVFPIIGDYQPANNTGFISRVVTNSCDPNEKTVLPKNGLTPVQLAAGNWLDYTIHFQNTGTDTAFTVVIKDTLSSLLDLGSLQIMGSSHPVTMQILDHNTVIWTFDNILLPDSNINEPLSNGFISYRIKPLSNLNINDHIENTAYIYFDYNLPVITNTTSSYILDPYSVPVQTMNENNLTVMPNPFTDNCNIQFYLKEPSPVLIEIYDITGNKIATICDEIQQQGDHSINYTFQKTNAEQFYLIRMITNKGQATKKAIRL